MTNHTASCRCGQLRATVSGEPVRVSVCHCLNCKKRSGSAFAAQARWPEEQITIEGRSNSFELVADSGRVGLSERVAAGAQSVWPLVAAWGARKWRG